MSRRNANKLLAILHGIFERAVRKHGLLANPVKDVAKLRESYDAARFDWVRLFWRDGHAGRGAEWSA